MTRALLRPRVPVRLPGDQHGPRGPGAALRGSAGSQGSVCRWGRMTGLSLWLSGDASLPAR